MSVKGLVTAVAFESVTLIVKLAVRAVADLPLNRPVVALMENPFVPTGKLPADAIAHV